MHQGNYSVSILVPLFEKYCQFRCLEKKGIFSNQKLPSIFHHITERNSNKDIFQDIFELLTKIAIERIINMLAFNPLVLDVH